MNLGLKMTTDNHLKLDDELFRSFFKERGLHKLRDVQSVIIPKILQRESLSLISPTGSGKTYAYALPLIQMIKEAEGQGTKMDCAPLLIVLTPTRELSSQVFKVMKDITHHIKLRVRQLVKGRPLKGPFEILIGNPGGLHHALKSKQINSERLSFLVCDEADQLLDQGFSREIELIIKELKDKSSVQYLFITASRPDDLSERLDRICPVPLKNYDFVQHMGRTPKGEERNKIKTYQVHLKEAEKQEMLKLFLKRKKMTKGIIFVNKKESGESLIKEMEEIAGSLEINLLHGGLSAQERRKVFKKFSETDSLLLATDIAARGIDLPQLDWVLNYDLPTHAVYYLHRAGRVGRGAKEGEVVNFVTHRDLELVKKINQSIREQSILRLETLKLQGAAAKKKVLVKKKAAPLKGRAKSKKKYKKNKR